MEIKKPEEIMSLQDFRKTLENQENIVVLHALYVDNMKLKEQIYKLYEKVLPQYTI